MEPGEAISYLDMCAEEGVNLQRGMNFQLRKGRSVVLMSTRTGAPYADVIENDCRTLIYEGHDVPRTGGTPNPKQVDQPMRLPGGALTQNGLFFEAAKRHADEGSPTEHVRVYQKIRSGLWAFAGVFDLVDAWIEQSGARSVFKFRLEITGDSPLDTAPEQANDQPHTRIIPTAVKQQVWKRDKGKCVKCGSTENLHFDHDIPYSRGGSSPRVVHMGARTRAPRRR